MRIVRALINRKTAYTIISSLVIILGSWVAIRYARGEFRIDQRQLLRNTGLLSANSLPTGAQVYIDDKLVSATDDTIYLEPGQYRVEFRKEGYRSWQKNLTIAEELVTGANARLFPIAPSLTTLTFTGIENINPSPDGRKILYYTASASAARKNGLYVLDLAPGPLSFQDGPRQIAEDSAGFSLADARFIWSPDSTQILLIDELNDREVLLEASQNNDLDLLPSQTFQKRQLLIEWEDEMLKREAEFLAEFPTELIAIATQSAENVYFSPDKQKLLYTATAAATLPANIVADALPTPDTDSETRQLEPGQIYVFDLEEDRNYLVGSTAESAVGAPSKSLLVRDITQAAAQSQALVASGSTRLQASTSAQTITNFKTYHSSLYTETFQWFPDSKHLLYSTGETIKIMNFDGTNDTDIYSGPFRDQFVYPWPDGNRLLIVTSFNPESPANLYAIELK